MKTVLFPSVVLAVAVSLSAHADPEAAAVPASTPRSGDADSVVARARTQAAELLQKGDIAGAQALLAFVLSLENGTPSPSAPTAAPDTAPAAPATRTPPVPGTRKTVRVGSVEVTLCWCPAGGSFVQGFWMAETEVTQGLWKEVMGENPSSFPRADDFPVEMVSWEDCEEFLAKINALPSVFASGLRLRLPSEVEWKYACRAGGTGSFCRLADGTEVSEESLSRVARYGKDWKKKEGTTAVRSLEPNAWGLYDMLGNVEEWTQSADGEKRIVRGGGWSNTHWDCQVDGETSYVPGASGNDLGFRLCASAEPD